MRTMITKMNLLQRIIFFLKIPLRNIIRKPSGAWNNILNWKKKRFCGPFQNKFSKCFYIIQLIVYKLKFSWHLFHINHTLFSLTNFKPTNICNYNMQLMLTLISFIFKQNNLDAQHHIGRQCFHFKSIWIS